MGPAFIHTLLDLAAVVELGTTTETLYLEFKRTIPNWNPPPGISNRHERIQEAQKEACRDIAQFANTLGGCLLIGVEGKFDPVRGVNVADSVVSVNEPEKLQQWVEQAVINYLVPSTFDHAVASIRHPAGNIIAINIPACQYLVSLWERKARTIEYVRRTSLGKEWMNPDEMERHLMNGSRAAKLTLISVRERSTSEQVEVLGGVWLEYPSSPGRPTPWTPSPAITFGKMTEDWFELCVPNSQGVVRTITMPYGLIKEAWVGASGVLMLLLTIRIIVHDDKVTLAPYA